MIFKNVKILCKCCNAIIHYDEVEIDMDEFDFSVGGSVCMNCGHEAWLIVYDEEELETIQ